MWDKTSFLLFYATILVAQKAAAAQILDGRFANTVRPATTCLSTSAILQSTALGTSSKAQIPSLVATSDSSSLSFASVFSSVGGSVAGGTPRSPSSLSMQLQAAPGPSSQDLTPIVIIPEPTAVLPSASGSPPSGPLPSNVPVTTPPSPSPITIEVPASEVSVIASIAESLLHPPNALSFTQVPSSNAASSLPTGSDATMPIVLRTSEIPTSTTQMPVSSLLSILSAASSAQTSNSLQSNSGFSTVQINTASSGISTISVPISTAISSGVNSIPTSLPSTGFFSSFSSLLSSGLMTLPSTVSSGMTTRPLSSVLAASATTSSGSGITESSSFSTLVTSHPISPTSVVLSSSMRRPETKIPASTPSLFSSISTPSTTSSILSTHSPISSSPSSTHRLSTSPTSSWSSLDSSKITSISSSPSSSTISPTTSSALSTSLSTSTPSTTTNLPTTLTKTTSASASASSTTTAAATVAASTPSKSTIAGAVVGGTAGLLLAVIAALYLLRRRSQRAAARRRSGGSIYPELAYLYDPPIPGLIGAQSASDRSNPGSGGLHGGGGGGGSRGPGGPSQQEGPDTGAGSTAAAPLLGQYQNQNQNQNRNQNQSQSQDQIQGQNWNQSVQRGSPRLNGYGGPVADASGALAAYSGAGYGERDGAVESDALLEGHGSSAATPDPPQLPPQRYQPGSEEAAPLVGPLPAVGDASPTLRELFGAWRGMDLEAGGMGQEGRRGLPIGVGQSLLFSGAGLGIGGMNGPGRR